MLTCQLTRVNICYIAIITDGPGHGQYVSCVVAITINLHWSYWQPLDRLHVVVARFKPKALSKKSRLVRLCSMVIFKGTRALGLWHSCFNAMQLQLNGMAAGGEAGSWQLIEGQDSYKVRLFTGEYSLWYQAQLWLWLRNSILNQLLFWAEGYK